MLDKLDVVSSLRVLHMSVLLFRMGANESSVQVTKIAALPTLVVLSLLPTYVTHNLGHGSCLAVANQKRIERHVFPTFYQYMRAIFQAF